MVNGLVGGWVVGCSVCLRWLLGLCFYLLVSLAWLCWWFSCGGCLVVMIV